MSSTHKGNGNDNGHGNGHGNGNSEGLSNGHSSPMSVEESGSSASSNQEEEGEVSMDLQTNGDENGHSDEMDDAPMNDGSYVSDVAPNLEGKRVKVYELRDGNWHDRGTGQCKGVYDDTRDIAALIVESEDTSEGEKEGEGGFLKEEMLLHSKVEKDDIYQRQQDTLIVWTEPGGGPDNPGLDIALSFQDVEGCEDIWSFIIEVQRHLNNQPVEPEATPAVPSSSSPPAGSPVLSMATAALVPSEVKDTWQPVTLANVREQEMSLRMAAKSATGRERAVEHILNEDYIKQLIGVFEQAEDLESLDDLHHLCSLMQTILLFNDNGIFEYILQDAVFVGVIGMLEYDPDFPTLKASYRQFFQSTSKFRQVIPIQDAQIRSKIHQTYRLLYLKDVVLARMLDDPTFGILNGFVFFNQVDIINHIQNNGTFLRELFGWFSGDGLELKGGGGAPVTPNTGTTESEVSERKKDAVLFLHQLMLMGKGIQIPSRLALYRALIDQGLFNVIEWSFRQTPEAEHKQIIHAAGEVLTLVTEHDTNAVRMHVLREHQAGKRTLMQEIGGLMGRTENAGLGQGLGEGVRCLIDAGGDETFAQRKEGPTSESFLAYFYETCAPDLYQPLHDLPDIKGGIDPPVKLVRRQIALSQQLVEMLSFSMSNAAQSHRVAFFILANPTSRKVVSLLYIKDKPLRHAALRFVKASLRMGNHFVCRHFTKNDLFRPLIDLLEEESSRDNMLSSACMDVLDLIRKENIKIVINHLFETFRPRLEVLSKRPYLRSIIQGLTTRWEQNNEPPPAPPATSSNAESSTRSTKEKEEEDYFNASDEEETIIGPVVPRPSNPIGYKRKRTNPVGSGSGGEGTKISPMSRREKVIKVEKRIGKLGKGKAGLGLDYTDDSDSEGSSSGGSSPKGMGRKEGDDVAMGTEEDLGDVAMKMRAKRHREEEEEEGFVGLVGKAKALKRDEAGGSGVGEMPKVVIGSLMGGVKDEEGETKAKVEKVDSGGSPAEGRKIRLSFGSSKKAG